MSELPTPFTVVQRTPVDGPPDVYGNPQQVWQETPRDVYGWHPPVSEEPDGTLDPRVVADVILLAPTFPVGSGDEFAIPGFDRPLRVEGLPKVMDHGPFGWQPGQQISLKLG